MNGGSLTSRQGHLFHVTNTNAIITLNGVKLVNDDSVKVLLSVCADGWQGACNGQSSESHQARLDSRVVTNEDVVNKATLIAVSQHRHVVRLLVIYSGIVIAHVFRRLSGVLQKIQFYHNSSLCFSWF